MNNYIIREATPADVPLARLHVTTFNATRVFTHLSRRTRTEHLVRPAEPGLGNPVRWWFLTTGQLTI